MKTLEQVVKEIEGYQCTEGREEDREVRSLIIRVDLLFDAYTHLDAHVKKNFENIHDCFRLFNDMFDIFIALDPSIKAVEKQGEIGLGQISDYQRLQTLNIAFEREDLLRKYEGQDKKFVEAVTKDIDEYVHSTYGQIV